MCCRKYFHKNVRYPNTIKDKVNKAANAPRNIPESELYRDGYMKGKQARNETNQIICDKYLYFIIKQSLTGCMSL